MLLHLEEEIEDGSDVGGSLRYAMPPVMPPNLPLMPPAEAHRRCLRRAAGGRVRAASGECLRQVQGLLRGYGFVGVTHYVQRGEQQR